jgi:hypothetical protein
MPLATPLSDIKDIVTAVTAIIGAITGSTALWQNTRRQRAERRKAITSIWAAEIDPDPVEDRWYYGRIVLREPMINRFHVVAIEARSPRRAMLAFVTRRADETTGITLFAPDISMRAKRMAINMDLVADEKYDAESRKYVPENKGSAHFMLEIPERFAIGSTIKPALVMYLESISATRERSKVVIRSKPLLLRRPVPRQM